MCAYHESELCAFKDFMDLCWFGGGGLVEIAIAVAFLLVWQRNCCYVQYVSR